MRDCSHVSEPKEPRQIPARPIEQVRERVIAALSEHFARDHLSIDELETRMARVYSSSTPHEVDALLEGLPALTVPAPAETGTELDARAPKMRQRLVAFMGGIVRRGLWVVPRRLRVVAVMGGVDLDLRQAQFPPGITEIHAFVLMGGLAVRVPPGVRLETDGFAFLGGFEDRVDDAGVARDAPVVRITGVAIMGGVDAKVLPIGTDP